MQKMIIFLTLTLMISQPVLAQEAWHEAAEASAVCYNIPVSREITNATTRNIKTSRNGLTSSIMKSCEGFVERAALKELAPVPTVRDTTSGYRGKSPTRPLVRPGAIKPNGSD